MIGTAMLVPLYAATFVEMGASEHWWWWLAVIWFAAGYIAPVLVVFGWAPSRIELRDEGLLARYWWGSRLGSWSAMRPSRRLFSTWQGWQLNEPNPGGSGWRHFVLTLEQARAVVRDPRFLGRPKVSPRVVQSLGLDGNLSPTA